MSKNDDIDAGVVTNSRIERLALPDTGIYRIEVRSYGGQNGGEYTLIIESDRGN